MKGVFAAVLLLPLSACGEQVAERYQTYAEAQEAGAIARGWIPAFVPANAREIWDAHDLDSNRQTLHFVADASDVQAMVKALHPVSREHQEGVADLTRRHDFPASAQAYAVCAKPLNGVLIAEGGSGRVVYTTAVAWADDECSEG